MPIYEASYRAWEGRGGRRAGARRAIASTMVRRVMRILLVKIFILVVVIGTCGITSFLLYFRHEEIVREMLARTGLEKINALFLVNRGFLNLALGLSVIVAAIAGAPLIAEDRRARSLPLYFSRPITPLDYVLGKLLAVAFFLALVLAAPPVLMYVIDAGLSKEPGAMGRAFPDFLRSLVVPCAAIACFSSIALGGSALARRPPYAALIVFGCWMFSFAIAELLARRVFDRDWDWLLLSPTWALQRIAIETMPLPPGAGIPVHRHLGEAGVGWAFASVAGWCAAGLGTVILRIRRAEVVT